MLKVETPRVSCVEVGATKEYTLGPELIVPPKYIVPRPQALASSAALSGQGHHAPLEVAIKSRTSRALGTSSCTASGSNILNGHETRNCQ